MMRGMAGHGRWFAAGYWVAGVLIAAMLAGCASLGMDRRSQGLETATNHYRTALRWGDFEGAYALLPPDQRGAEDLPSVFNNLRVTRYEVMQPALIRPDNTATQTVSIEYLYEHNQVLRRVTDRQVWRWDDGQKAWWLESGLPDFADGKGAPARTR